MGEDIIIDQGNGAHDDEDDDFQLQLLLPLLPNPLPHFLPIMIAAAATA